MHPLCVVPEVIITAQFQVTAFKRQGKRHGIESQYPLLA